MGRKSSKLPFCIVNPSSRPLTSQSFPQKIIIVNRKLTAAANGVIDPPPAGPPDVEVREVWQPWLKHRCDFVVRYIVPHRTNIIETMEGKRRFHSEVSYCSGDLPTDNLICAHHHRCTSGRPRTARRPLLRG